MRISQTFLFNFCIKLFSNDFLNSLLWQCVILYIFVTSNDIHNMYNRFLFIAKGLEQKQINSNNISKDEFESLYDDFISDKNIYLELVSDIEKSSMIDIIYNTYYNNKQLKHQIKEFNLYFTNIKYINYIKNIINDIPNTNLIICNLFSGCGRFINNIYNENNNYYLFDYNEIINQISYFNLIIKYKNTNNIKINTTNIITFESNEKYDLILAELPEDMKNLIYTNCNSKIKSLKIRGTKSEPLIIQYITQILNKNGSAIIITPNSLLFGDSNQHIQTRKYIIENFGVKVINLDNKKSILYIDKNNKLNIIFSFYDNDEKYNFEFNDIKNNNYSFYYYNYFKSNKNIDNSNLISLHNIIDIIDSKNSYSIDNNSEILYSYRYNLFDTNKYANIQNYDYLFLTKNNEKYQQKFINYYLTNLFNIYLKNITKGKMNQLNLDYIKELKIIVPSINVQNNIINYYEKSKQMNDLLTDQINNLEIIKNTIITNTIIGIETIKLEDICNISHETNKINTICINRNTINAGYINLTNTQKETSTNMYYLNINNTDFIQDYIYFILLYFQNDIIKLANGNKTVGLSKKSLDTFEIPNLSLDNQKNLINKINNINNSISNSILFIEKNNIKLNFIL